MHPLYRHATTLVGQPIYVHCNGRVHHGVLHSVTSEGVYLRPMNRTGTASATHDDSLNVQQLPLTETENMDIENVFWPLFFLPWLAIGALGPWAWW